MARALKVIGLILLLAFPLATALSEPRQTRGSGYQPEQTGSFNESDITLTAIYATITAQAAGPGVFPPESTAPAGQEPALPTPTPTPSFSPEALILIDARADLELLANQQLGVGSRPEGWSGSTDYTNPQMGLLARLDLELLYGGLIDRELRNPAWFGAVGSSALAIARDVRHDLELLADLLYGYSVRPEGWRGADPLYRCSRATQTLVTLLARGGVFTLDVEANDPDFCAKAEVSAARFAETRVLSGSVEFGGADPALTLASGYRINRDFAVAFLDPSARIKLGVIPNGTPIQVIARSYSQFSNMMLVAGDGFQVYVEYVYTSVTPAEFRGLPNITSIAPAPSCFAEWCTPAP